MAAVSYQAMTAVTPLKGLDPCEKFVLMILANYATVERTAWPAQKTLAADTGLSERTVFAHLKNLEARGLISRRKRYAGGSRTSDMFTLNFIPATVAPIEVPKPATVSVHTRKKPHLIPATIAEKPVIEPIIEPSARAKPLMPVESQAARAKRQAEMAANMRELASQLGTKR